MSTVNDYIGRTVDVSALQGQAVTQVESGRPLSETLALENEGGLIIAGVVKLAQRWVLEFLTERGTIFYEQNRGTDFYTFARLGFFRTVLEAEQQFFSALIDLRRNLIAEETEDMPDDERYFGTELFSITLVPDLLVIRARVYSVAGNSREVILPIRTTIGGFGSS
jgi:hypothetical protein